MPRTRIITTPGREFLTGTGASDLGGRARKMSRPAFLLTQGVARGNARTELLKLAVRKIVEEALDTASTTAFFEDLKRRGLTDHPAGRDRRGPGLIRAVE